MKSIMKSFALFIAVLLISQLLLPLWRGADCCVGEEAENRIACKIETPCSQEPASPQDGEEVPHGPCDTGCNCICCGARILLGHSIPEIRVPRLAHRPPTLPSSGYYYDFSLLIWHPPKV